MEKIIIITGGNDGIGYYMVKASLEQGHKVAVLDIEVENLIKLKEKHPDKLIFIQCDVSNDKLVKESINNIIKQFEKIDYAIHNACYCPFSSFVDTDNKKFNKTLGINYYGAINLTRAVLPFMKKQEGGKIFYTSSGVGITGFKNISAYASSKGAIESLAKCLKLEYGDTNISFHILHPPLTDTKSSSPLPVPKEFKKTPKNVGYNLVHKLDSNKFIISSSIMDSLSVRVSYLFPLFMGRMLTKMTERVRGKK